MPSRNEWFDLPDRPLGSPDVAILGLPYDATASRRRGAAQAPQRLRELSRSSDALDRRGREILGITLRDFGDVQAATPAGKPRTQPEFLVEAARRLDGIPAESFPILLGGDNSISIPALEWFARRRGAGAGVLWFDAHPDLFASYDGNADSHACALRRGMELSGLDPSHAVLLGTRSFAAEERAFIRETGMELITAADWIAGSPSSIVDRIAARLQDCPAIYLAIDIDGFDASCAPGTGYPMPGGIDAERFFATLELLMDRVPVRAVDLTEIAPPLDVNDATSFLGVQIVLEVLSAVGRIAPEARF